MLESSKITSTKRFISDLIQNATFNNWVKVL